MKKLFRIIIFWLFPVSFVLLITFFINIFIVDFRFAHQSHMVYQHPFSWSKYFFFLPIKKFFINIKNDKDIGLDQVHLYISDASKEKLLKKTPKSTKKWVQGSLLNSSGNLQNIEVRYRGDNPRNWLFEKKSLRIKTRKQEMFERRRYYEYWPFSLKLYLPSNIANKMGVLSSKSKLVELFINGRSNGIFIENERIDENFLRRNKIMPINLYKGENYNAESLIGIDENLFNNPGLWNKSAIFNQNDDQDVSDLKYFLSIIQAAETREEDFDELLNNINLDTWATFSAFTVLTQNYHHDYIHNIRIAIDPWSGHASPIVVDPALASLFKKSYIYNLKNSVRLFETKVGYENIFPLETSNNDLINLLNRSSIFIDVKYEKIFHYIMNKNVIVDEINSLQNISNLLKISANRDPEINSKELIKKIEIYKKDLKKIENSVKEKFFSEPLASWNRNSKSINIFIQGEMPISKIKLNFDSETPEWVAIDENYNGKIDSNEHKFFSNGEKSITIDANFYANRIALSKKKTDMHTRSSVIVAKTKFSLITDKDILPINIFGENPFSKKQIKLSYSKNKDAVQMTKFNKIIYKKELNQNIDNFLEFSNNVYIKGNYILEKPVKINPGTNFLMAKNSHIIFKNKVIAKGTSKKPIVFKKLNNSSNAWGTVALVGKKSSGSVLTNVLLDGGSGGNYKQLRFTSMLSLHNTQNIRLEKIKLSNHTRYDDMLHIIYCDNIYINEAELNNAYGDAIDVDISTNIKIENSNFLEAQNDSIDFMESEAAIISSSMIGSKDKGISVGENSNILIFNSSLEKNNTGLAVKDRSNVEVIHTNFQNNLIHLNLYSKNWQYGGGGNGKIYRSYFLGNNNLIKSSDKSYLVIDDSTILGKKTFKGKNILTENMNFSKKNIDINKNKLKITHPMRGEIFLVNNNKHGSNLITNNYR